MVESSSSRESITPRDFSKVAEHFVAKYKGHIPPEVGSVAEGMQAVDRRLRTDSGKLVYVGYHKSDRNLSAVSIIGKTDGQGLRVSTDPESGKDQITFGKDAVLVDSEFRANKVVPQREVVIPEGASLELFTGSRSFRKPFLIGDEEIKDELHKSIPDAAEFAFMLEQTGISPQRFFTDYLDAERLPFSRREAENKITRLVVGDLEAYGIPASPVTVLPISLQDGVPLVKKNGECASLERQVQGDGVLDQGRVNWLTLGTANAMTTDPFSRMKWADEAYYLSWDDHRHIPRGAQLHGMRVTDAYNGMLHTTEERGYLQERRPMGSYLTVVDSGGETGMQQSMIVLISKALFPENQQR